MDDPQDKMKMGKNGTAVVPYKTSLPSAKKNRNLKFGSLAVDELAGAPL